MFEKVTGWFERQFAYRVFGSKDPIPVIVGWIGAFIGVFL